MTRARIILGFLATVVIACGAMDAPRTLLAPMESTASLGVDSTHAAIQRRRLDTLAVDLARYCQTKGSKGYLCDDRASLDSARSLEVYVAPLPAPVDTTPAPPPPPPPPPAPTGVRVLPGQSIQGAVDANPAGTTFLLGAGTHARQMVGPKDGDTFIGEGAGTTILDGQSATTYAFNGYNGSRWVNGVTIKKLTVTRYTPPAQIGAIRGIDFDKSQGSTAWTLDSVEVSYNKNLGVKVSNRWRILRSYLHHNGTINIGGSGVGILIDGSRFTYGNDGCPNDPGFESGGSKFSLTDSLIVRNSTFSNSCGPGLWLDINNRWYLLENNLVEDNVREGIVTEISYQGVIRNNQVRRNGMTPDPYRVGNWLWKRRHRDPRVVRRRGLRQSPRGQLQRHRSHSAEVHDNTVYQRADQPAGKENSVGGAVQDVGDNAIFTSRNNRWVHNTYYTGTRARPFTWLNTWRTPAEWRGYGQDVTGTFAP